MLHVTHLPHANRTDGFRSNRFPDNQYLDWTHVTYQLPPPSLQGLECLTRVLALRILRGVKPLQCTIEAPHSPHPTQP